MPFEDYQLMLEIRDSLLNAGVKTTKSEILRAALHALKRLPVDEVAKVVGTLEPVKTGRPPRKNKKAQANSNLQSVIRFSPSEAAAG
jgi:hypothetical protein